MISPEVRLVGILNGPWEAGSLDSSCAAQNEQDWCAMRMPDFVKKTGTLLVLLLGGGGLVGVSALFDVPKLLVEFFQWAIIEPTKPPQALEVSTAGKVIIVVGIVAVAAAGVWLFQRIRPSRGGLGEAGRLYDSI